ncbi:hypothetical protein [Rhodococcus rhodochrous]|uniref:hypothetical protein n=1 Tax=Rhodococcus rhodochrous TaxID=1829 RepID=UPI00135207FC|nr:hypothetical protein [Rhodococcus rhodochrous]
MAEKKQANQDQGEFNKSMDSVERFNPVRLDENGQQTGRSLSEASASDLDDD